MMLALFKNLCCKLGFHDWQSDSAVVKDDCGGRPVALGWKVCRRCSESKLTLILR